MDLVNGCSNFCDQCSIFRNSIICDKCTGNRIILNGNCVCNSLSDETQLCVNSCDGCQPCIKDCYSCKNIKGYNYSNVCPPVII